MVTGTVHSGCVSTAAELVVAPVFMIDSSEGRSMARELVKLRYALGAAEDGTKTCDEATPKHLASCWQAGEIIRSRCLAENESEEVCEERLCCRSSRGVGEGGNIDAIHK